MENKIVLAKEIAARAVLIAAVQRGRGNLSVAARELGLPRRKINRELARYGLNVPAILDGTAQP